MEKAIKTILHGAFTVVKGPLLFLLLISAVISAMRHPPRRLAPARVRRLPRA